MAAGLIFMSVGMFVVFSFFCYMGLQAKKDGKISVTSITGALIFLALGIMFAVFAGKSKFTNVKEEKK